MLLDCLALRVILDQEAAEETQDRLDWLENVDLKVLKDPLVWLDCQLRREREEMADPVVNKDPLVKRDPEVFQESLVLKDSRELKAQLEAPEPRVVTVSQAPREALVHLELLEIRVPREELDLLVSLDKRATAVTRDPLDPLDSLVLLEDLDLKDQL